MRAPTIVIACLLVLAGCGGGEESPPDAGSLDASRVDAGTLDAGSVEDGSIEDAGSGEDGSGEDASGEDAGPGEDASIEDAGPGDAGTDASSLRIGPVQCRSSADCAGPAASCNREAPGGICLGCAEGTCPSGTECAAGFGACVRDCDSDLDCNAGLRYTATGRCAVRACGPTSACPAPYVCGDTQCERPSCAGGVACPAPLLCSADVCVEP